MSDAPTFSIIVPVKAYNAYCTESLGTCERLYPEEEILFSPDEASPMQHPGVTVLPSGPRPPSVKRDLCAAQARGPLLAFLDDDAYPEPGWLEAAREIFQDPEVGAVGGPAVTPQSDSLSQWASGLVYSSRLCGGPYGFRYLPRPARLVDDYPTCNLLVRADVFKAIGGFDTGYWPGEDTVACLKIVHEQGKKIVYDPRVLVNHHRRKLFWGHFKQVNSYARHRGFFVKRFPKTSLRLSYFLPSALLAYAAFGWAPARLLPMGLTLWSASLAAYAMLAIGEGLGALREAPARHRGLRLAALVAGGIVMTHLSYGFNFLVGLSARDLDGRS